MSDNAIRKEDSLGSSAAQLHADFKESHAKYNDLVSDLALLTKSELRPVITQLRGKTEINGLKTEINQIFEKIDSVLYDMSDSHSSMDETVQTIGGLEFSTANTVDKFAIILKDQESQHSRMSKAMNLMREEFNDKIDEDPSIVETILEDLEEFQLDFSRFQDYVQESVPKVSKLFDELDEEEDKGIKYGKTNKL